MSWRCIGEMAV